MVPANIIAILQKRRENQALTGPEKEQLREWFRSTGHDTLFSDEQWKKDLALYLQLDADDQQMEASLQRLYKTLQLTDQKETAIEPQPAIVRTMDSAQPVPFLRSWGWVAAAVVLLLSVGAYFWQIQHAGSESKNDIATAAAPKDIPPGKEGAILTLADGRQVILDSLGNGVIALQNGSQAVIKNGQLVYDPAGNITGEVLYNTMTTPKGRQYSLLLPDGTKVWLNAASSIRYPTVFVGGVRQVEMQGEAYFEVAKNTNMPFHVNVNSKASVEVLGTHFNVNAYENEGRIQTTLLEGSVRVSITANKSGRTASTQNGNKLLVLQPGQQAQIINSDSEPHSNTEIKLVHNADIDKVMAWKNGAFNFDGLSLLQVMRQIERWYNIRVQFEGSASERIIGGEMGRNLSLFDVLEILEQMNVKYKWNGSTLTIL